MTAWTLIFRGLRYHAQSHLGVLFGAVVGSAVLVGALVVGDSVRWSLRQFALARLGNTEIALVSGDRFFGARLASDLQNALSAPVAPALQLLGAASRGDQAARANRVQVTGIDERFWQLSSSPLVHPLSTNAVLLNDRLAGQLNARVGDPILLRVPKPSALSRDAPISPQEDSAVALRLTVEGILTDDQMGRFSLQANQTAPYNAFVSLTRLQNQLDISNRANLLLVGQTSHLPAHSTNPTNSSIGFSVADGPLLTLSNTTAALLQRWQLTDAQLELRALPAAGAVELRSSRVFLDSSVARAALQVSPTAGGVLTYFVNQLKIGGRTTPYSIVTAMGQPVTPPGMRDDEILINQWLADDLQAQTGDSLELRYFVVGALRNLEERAQTFRVRAILPMQGPGADRDLMPDFPGLSKAENCRDWDAGFPIRLDLIRPKDEKYWHDYRGTPKAFVTLAAGQKMWANRFGDLTAIRFPLVNAAQPADTNLLATAVDDLGRRLHQALNPAEFGLSFRPVRQQALAASEEAQDFGQLFLGFSFFLIVAALLLMALLFQFGIELRTVEIGTLLALGFPPRRVRALLLGEAGVLALLGGILGVLGGSGYAQAMLYGLSTIWRQAVGTSALRYHAEPVTLAIGASISAIIAFLTIFLAIRAQARRPARELLASGAESSFVSQSLHSARDRRNKIITVIAGLGGLAALGFGLEQAEASPGLFFAAGALLLLCGITLASWFLSTLARSDAASRLSLTGMGLRNSTRRRKRSLATIVLLACGSFLIVAVGSNRLDSVRDAQKRSSGTGGFALVGESSLPIVQDLNSSAGRDFYGLDAQTMTNVAVVPLRIHEGDDASCLNLNRAQTPRLLGVRPEWMQSRGAFTFAQVTKGASRDKGWDLLRRKTGDDTVPAIGDQASITWALHKKVGDVIPFMDEKGRSFKLRLVGALANSTLQGSLVIAEDEFTARFPSESGYRMFLIDAPPSQSEKVASALSRSLQDTGLELTPASRRLDAFNAVQNTYLSTFQVLGGLGLLLGSLGLGVVVLRNVLERRSELALLLAVGYRPRTLKFLVLSEHGALLLLGLGIGIGAAIISVLPALLSPGSELPYRTLGLTLGAILVSGALWTWLATWFALRGKLLDALRND